MTTTREAVSSDLAAFMEVHLALKNGIANPQLEAAVREKQLFYRHKSVAGIDFDRVYEDFGDHART